MQQHNRKFNPFRRFGLLFVIALAMSIWFGQGISVPGGWQWGTVVNAQPTDAAQFVQQGVERYQRGDIAGAIAPWQDALTIYRTTGDRANQAIVLENLARAYQAIGQLDQAIAHWQQGIDYYQQAGNLPQMGRLLTEQAQVYSRLGQYRQAIALLCGHAQRGDLCAQGSALQLARAYHNPTGETAALGSLGEAYRLMGDYDQAIQYLQVALETARMIENPVYLSATLNSLGNAYVSLAQLNYRRAISATQIGDDDDAFRQAGLEYDIQALEVFQEGQTLARQQNDQLAHVRSLLNAIPSYYRTGENPSAIATTQQTLALLEQLPDSQEKVYAAIDLAHLLQPGASDNSGSRIECFETTSEPQAMELLQDAIATAQQMGDRRSESFALGELGHLYECRQAYSQALELTQQARWSAEQELDSRYLWEWQTGRILQQQGDVTQAIAAYERAIATLETIRSDILVAERDIQFDFRDTIEPIYRQLVELRLEQEQSSVLLSLSGRSKQNIDTALSRLDALRLAELQNYFGNDCVLVPLNPERVIDTKSATAVFSSVILDNRTAIIVTFPNGQQQIEWIDVDRNTLIQEVNDYRTELERFFDLYNPQRSQTLYNWIIRPFISGLQQFQVKTLVFIQDGILRSVPMAALHDGEQFLIQQYAIATTPSLTLTTSKPLNRQNLRALALGLTEQTAVDGRLFPALTNVNQEIQGIADQLPNSKSLLNQEFTRDRLEQELDQNTYSIVHIATHGEFGTEPQDTFLVTGDGQKLTITDLDRILRSQTATPSIELLSLTACNTAVGNDRAALGLAGVAAQSSANSVLASLWFINDAATAQLVTTFYRELRNPNISKAQALRLAQLSLIESATSTHPAYWAPFILIGNWE